MATEAERNRIFEILGLTIGPGAGANQNIATIHTGFGVALTLTEMNKLRDEVNTHIDNLDAAKLISVQAIIADYDEIRPLLRMGVQQQDGSFGDISGVTVDPQKALEFLRQDMMRYVNVMHMADAIKQRAGPGGSSLSFSR